MANGRAQTLAQKRYTVGLPSADCLGSCRPAKTCLLVHTASRSGKSAWQRADILISGLSTDESAVSSVHGVCRPTVKMDERTLPSFLAVLLLAVVGKRYLFYLYCCWLDQMIDQLMTAYTCACLLRWVHLQSLSVDVIVSCSFAEREKWLRGPFAVKPVLWPDISMTRRFADEITTSSADTFIWRDVSEVFCQRNDQSAYRQTFCRQSYKLGLLHTLTKK